MHVAVRTTQYKPDNKWTQVWETFITLRKILLVVIALPLARLGGVGQGVLFIIALLVSLALQLKFKPFRAQSENMLETYNLGSIVAAV